MTRLLAIATLAAAAAAARPLDAPSASSQYPLLHIGDKFSCTHSGAPCAKDPANGKGYPFVVTAADAGALAAFSLRHISFSVPATAAAQMALLRAAGGGPIVKYTETRPVCGGSPGQFTPHVVCNATSNFETGGFRRDARVYLAANLTAAVGAADSEIDVCLATGSTPLVASTAAGNFSDYEGTAFVFFVRLGDELLKVTSASAPRGASCRQRLGVQRGLDGTAPAPAAAGAPLLAPVFVRGLPKASGALPFIAEYATFYAWSSLANFTVDAVTQLANDGAWFDSYSPRIEEADLGGAAVTAWNVAAGREMTYAEAFAGQVSRLNAVWADVLPRLPSPPVIWANNFELWFPYNDTDGAPVPGDRSFVVPAAAAAAGLSRPFDGASLENWSAAFQGGCWPQNGEASDSFVVYADEPTWLARVDAILDAAAANSSVAAMTGSAGCQSGLQVFLKSRARLDAMHYASFLMGVRATGGTPAAAAGPLLGTSAYFAPKNAAGFPVGLSAAELNPLYTLPLGAPAQSVASAAQYLIAPAVYARRFAAALVLVNPTPADAPAPTPLNGTYYDATAADPTAPLTHVTMAAQTGRVLLTQPPPPLVVKALLGSRA